MAELVLDLDALERNLRRMADLCARAGIALRPHTKTHRSPWVAQRQVALGAAGVAAATLDDTAMLVKAGVADVLVTSPIAPAAAPRLAELAELATVSIVVDSPITLLELSAAAVARGVNLPVLVDVDVGQGRTGTKPRDAGELAELAGSLTGVRFAGLQGYEGHCMLTPGTDAERRARCAADAYERLEVAKASLADRGIPVDWVTGAGTGTHALAIAAGVFTEIQPGSYCVMDSSYGEVLGSESFEPALFVRATVLSVNRTQGLTVDAGWKAVSTDAGPPTVRGGGSYAFAGDEHGKVTGVEGLRLGETVDLLPGHCDTTIHLHDRYTLVRGARPCGTLPIRPR
jgi:D-serine deaminase-like pyridoxal phosphate-dependent protein